MRLPLGLFSTATGRQSSSALVPGRATGTGLCPGSRLWTKPKCSVSPTPLCLPPQLQPLGPGLPQVWSMSSSCGPPTACLPSASSPWPSRPLICPRHATWPRFFPFRLALLPTSAVLLLTLSEGAALSGWLMTSFKPPCPWAASRPLPSSLEPRPYWPSRPATTWWVGPPCLSHCILGGPSSMAHLPALGTSLHAEDIPPSFKALAELLDEVFTCQRLMPLPCPR